MDAHDRIMRGGIIDRMRPGLAADATDRAIEGLREALGVTIEELGRAGKAGADRKYIAELNANIFRLGDAMVYLQSWPEDHVPRKHWPKSLLARRRKAQRRSRAS